MGQYYKQYVKDKDGNERKFNPQNAVFLTKSGLDEARGYGDPNCSWDLDDTWSYGSLFNGLKLMEHSWIDNGHVNGVLEAIEDNPCQVAWVGDYADEAGDFDERYTEEVRDAVWSGNCLKDSPFAEMPSTHRDGFLANLDKGAYIDLAEYIGAATYTQRWDRSGGEWCIHPLPLLTAIGNGRGCGDYHGTCMGAVGAWAMDEIMYTRDASKLDGLEKVDAAGIAFREE